MLVITGTGRSGTSAMALWLKKLGLINYDCEYIEQFQSGYEPYDVKRVNNAIWLGNDPAMMSIPAQTQVIKSVDYPIIKDERFFYGLVLNTWLSVRQDLKFLICLRKFNDVHKSRIRANQLNMVRKPNELEQDFGRFLSQLVFHKIPFEIVCYPDFIDEYGEVYKKIKRLEPELDLNWATGKRIWEETMDKSLIN